MTMFRATDQGNVPLTAEEIAALEAERAANANPPRTRDVVLAELAATDAEFQPRWVEDVAADYVHPSFADWKSRRAALRAELASME